MLGDDSLLQCNGTMSPSVTPITHVAFLFSANVITGPDVEFMEEILSQVGERHVKMGISVSFFPFLGNALVWAIRKDIGDEMTEEHEEAWEEVYDAISGEIVKAILNASK